MSNPGAPYTRDRKPSKDFVRKLRAFDPMLECWWNSERGIFEILRKMTDHRSSEVSKGLHRKVTHAVVLSCVDERTTPIFAGDGAACEIITGKEPGAWCLEDLARRDSHRTGGRSQLDEVLAHNDRLVAEYKARRRSELIAAENQLRYWARRDLNMAHPRVSIGVSGLRR